MAGQQLHTDGGAHQADIEYRGDYPGGSVAAECIRGFERTPACSCRQSIVLLVLSGEPKETLNCVRYRTDQVTFCVYRYK